MSNSVRNSMIAGSVGALLGGPIGAIAGGWLGHAMSAPDYVVSTADGTEEAITEFAFFFVDPDSEEPTLLGIVEPKDVKDGLKHLLKNLGWTHVDTVSVGCKVDADKAPTWISFRDAYNIVFN